MLCLKVLYQYQFCSHIISVEKLHASEAAYAHFLLPIHKDSAAFDFLQNTVMLVVIVIHI